MFGNLGWEHLLVLMVVGLLVLGPERLPAAIRWSADTLRWLRRHLDTTTSDLREQFGPEIAELREPLTQLQRLRAMNPQLTLTRYLLDGEEQAVPNRAGSSQASSDPALPPSVHHLPNDPMSPPPAAACDPQVARFDPDAT